jgi:glucose-1-phosphate adenylyltransferase
MRTTIAADTICIVLAGGVGSRLDPLTQERTKPAVPICGQYRIIDFTLSNCLHSGLRRILVLTQYKSLSLQKHLRDAWGIFCPELDEYVLAIPPQFRTGESWYTGTAGAIYQNLFELRKSQAKYVMILSGDHIYRMDYAAMLQRHRQTEADVSVACMEVSLEDARSFGVLAVDSENRIQRFEEKPQYPEPSPNNSALALASMGIYVFSKDVLCKELERDSQDASSSHDFGKDVLPRMIHTHRVFGYRYTDSKIGDSMEGYWRDVGCIDAYYQANMDFIWHQPPMDLYCES